MGMSRWSLKVHICLVLVFFKNSTSATPKFQVSRGHVCEFGGLHLPEREDSKMFGHTLRGPYIYNNCSEVIVDVPFDQRFVVTLTMRLQSKSGWSLNS